MNRRIFLKNGTMALVSLGFAPAFTLEQGLTAECQWLQQELDHAR